jgi:hypothetical protein
VETSVFGWSGEVVNRTSPRLRGFARIDRSKTTGHIPRAMARTAEVAQGSKLCRQRLLAAQLAWRERLAELIRAGQSVGAIRDDIDDINAVALSALTWSVWEGALAHPAFPAAEHVAR